MPPKLLGEIITQPIRVKNTTIEIFNASFRLLSYKEIFPDLKKNSKTPIGIVRRMYIKAISFKLFMPSHTLEFTR